MATLTVSRPRAVVDPPKANLKLVAFVELIETKLANNLNFPNLGTVLTDLTAARTGFAAALSNKNTLKDVGAACTAAKQVVIDKLGQAKSYVNGVAAQASPDQAMAIIESSGFRSRKVVIRVKLPLAVKYGGTGAVILVALAPARNAIYYFQVSSDEKTWTACPNVMKCKTTLSALTVGTTYYFRVQTQTRKGLSDWSSVVSFVAR